MTRYAIPLILTALACVAVVVIATRSVPATFSPGVATHLGMSPHIDVALLDGGRLTSADLRGEVVVMEFWATWCGPCVELVPHMKALQAHYEPRGVTFLGVSIDDEPGVARQFVQQHGMTWPQTHDPSSANPLSTQFQVQAIPHAMILTREGQVAWEGHAAELGPALERIVGAGAGE